MSLRFDSILRLDQIRSGERLEFDADAAELESVARRLGLSALERLDAFAVLDRKGDVVRATGRLRAALTQECVVTGELIPTHVEAPFDLAFTPESPVDGPDAEIELGPEDCDTVFYDGAKLPVGEAIADTLALSIDPYPRSAGADAALKDAGIMTEAEAGPFAALAALKGRLENDS